MMEMDLGKKKEIEENLEKAPYMETSELQEVKTSITKKTLDGTVEETKGGNNLGKFILDEAAVGPGLFEQMQKANIQHYTQFDNKKLEDLLVGMGSGGESKNEFVWDVIGGDNTREKFNKRKLPWKK